MAVGDLGVNLITLSGPATIYELPDLRETILTALSEGKDLHVDLETTGPWDLSGLQLLVSAAAMGRRAGQSVRLVNVPRSCGEIADRSGLSTWLTSVTDSFL